MSGRNPYHVLGLKKGATEAEIKEAYKVLAKKYHPDRNQGDKDALARFMEVKEAYDELIDRKSSKAISTVEEVTAGAVRTAREKQVGRKTLWMLAGLSAAFLSAVIGATVVYPRYEGWIAGSYLSNGDLDGATEWTRRCLQSHCVGGEDLRLAVAAARLDKHRLADVEKLLEGSQEARALAVLGDVRVETAKDGARGPAMKAWHDAWEQAKASATPERAAEIAARVFCGYLRVGADADADRVADEAQRLFGKESWTRWIADVRLVRAGRAAEILARRAKVESPEESTDLFGAAFDATVRIAALRSAIGPTGKAGNEDLDELRSALLKLQEAGSARVGQPHGLEFGYLYPALYAARPRLDDWRPTTSIEDPAGAMLLASGAGARYLNAADRARATDVLAQALGLMSRQIAVSEPAYDLFLSNAQGQLRLAAGASELDRADDAFGGILKKHPADPIALAGKAMVARGREAVGGKMGGEAAAWERAVAADPRRAEFHWALAQSYGRLGRSAQSVAEDRKAVELDPSFGLAWLDLGDALSHVGQVNDALHAYENAAKYRESALEANAATGMIYYDRRQLAPAKASLKKAAAVARSADDPRLAEVWFRLACIASLEHDEKGTRESMQHALGAGIHETLRIEREPALGWFRSRVDLAVFLREEEAAHRQFDASQRLLAPTPPPGGRP